VAARVQQRRIQAGQRGGEEALATLRDPRYLRVLDALDGLLAEPPLADAAEAPADEVLRDGLRRTARRFRRRVDGARAAAPGDEARALHEARKAGKRLRYTAEVAEPVLGRRATAVVACLEQVQDVLGESQDTEVTRAWCERLGREAFAAGENPFAFGRLHALEEARAERARAAFWALEPSVHPVLRAVRKKG
jgi:CHAD domain-containing protein